MSNGATQVVYEGTPASPDEHRHFQVIEKHGVTIYYTAPTLIRTFIKWGREIAFAHDLSSLRSFPLGGAPVPPALLERLARPVRVVAAANPRTVVLVNAGAPVNSAARTPPLSR